MNKTEITQKELSDLLQAINCSKISMDEVSEHIENMTNKEILSRHPYAITENKDGRFSTYLPDETKSSNRRKIVKATRELLEKEIIKLYKEREKEKSIENISLRNFYPEWFEYKSLHTQSSAYMKTIDELWKRYYSKLLTSLFRVFFRHHHNIIHFFIVNYFLSFLDTFVKISCIII